MTHGPSPGGVRALRALPLVLLLALAAPLAGAHATLQSADPSPGGHADVGLAVVELRFTEEVERDYTDADVIDSQGESAKAGPWEYGERKNVVRVPVHPLGDGIYALNWKALSVDSHTTRDSFVFAIGNATLRYVPPATGHDHSEHTREDIVRDGVARAVFYGGLFLVIGLPLFVVAVDRGATLPRSLLGTSALFGILGATAAFLNLLFLAERTSLPYASAAGTEAGGWFVWRGSLLAAAGLVSVVALLAPPARRRLLALLAVALGAGALLATSLGSHAAADDEMRAVSVTLDALHLAMGAVWIGGVVAFLHVVWGRDARQIGELVHRFSPLAITSVLLLLATGVYASLRHIPRVSALWEDWYGRLVVAKVALLGVLVLFGAFNQRVLGPRLRDGAASPRFFRRVLQAEAFVMVAVLAAAGVLASTPPPDREVQVGDQGPPPFLEFQNFTSHSHLIVQVSPNPVTVGIQRITVTLHPGADTPVPINRNATIALKIAAPGEPEPDVTMEPGPERIGTDTWITEGGYFTSPGNWTLHVLVQRTDVGEFSKVRFTIPVQPFAAAPTDPTTSSN